LISQKADYLKHNKVILPGRMILDDIPDFCLVFFLIFHELKYFTYEI